MAKFDIKQEVLQEISHFIEKVSELSETELFDASVDLHTRFPSLGVMERITQDKDGWKPKMRNLLLTIHIVQTMKDAGYDRTTVTLFLEEIVARTSGQSSNNQTNSSP